MNAPEHPKDRLSDQGEDASGGLRAKQGKDTSHSLKAEQGEDASGGLRAKQGKDTSHSLKAEQGEDASGGLKAEQGDDTSHTLKADQVRLQVVAGAELLPWLDAIARLRMSVFRAFPYLYEGDMAYEKNYLATYAGKPRAMTVLVHAHGRVAGASTALPLRDETPEVQAPFLKKNIPVDQVFYFGESVLDMSLRGQGIGVRFFEERERYARKLGGMRWLAFCAVERPVDHALRPADYEPLDRFWHNRGFMRQPDMQTTFRWTDVGQEHESAKTMTFWLKRIG